MIDLLSFLLLTILTVFPAVFFLHIQCDDVNLCAKPKERLTVAPSIGKNGDQARCHAEERVQ